MEYQLGLWQTVEANLVVKGSILGTTFFLMLYFVLPIVMYLLFPVKRVYRNIIVGLLLVVLWGGSIIPVWGSGWKINDEFWNIKAYGVLDEIKISSMEIGFVTNKGEWDTDSREFGANDPGLLSGKCRLKNKNKALVFNHYYQRERLLIKGNEKYYLIGHPGIEKLYDELIRLGAKEKVFEKSEVSK